LLEELNPQLSLKSWPRHLGDRLEMAHDVALSCATHMRVLLRLSLHVDILITDSTKLFLRSLESL
jgi:hypothetical protein